MDFLVINVYHLLILMDFLVIFVGCKPILMRFKGISMKKGRGVTAPKMYLNVLSSEGIPESLEMGR